MSIDLRPHALYRHFDKAGVLLYIGIAYDPFKRASTHHRGYWGPLIASMTVEWHPTSVEAAAAEKAAIKSEQPLYNVAHNAARKAPWSTTMPFDSTL